MRFIFIKIIQNIEDEVGGSIRPLKIVVKSKRMLASKCAPLLVNCFVGQSLELEWMIKQPEHHYKVYQS